MRSAQKKARRQSSQGGAASTKTPAKRGKAKNTTQQTAGEETEAPDETPQEPDGKISKETPKKAARGKKTPKKTPAKRTPAKKTPAKKTAAKKTDEALPTAEGGAVDTVQLKNGTPKRKYVKKRPAQEVEPVAEPACKEADGEPPTEPEEETQPGGRRRRGAAKA